jgi:hypothetical protein
LLIVRYVTIIAMLVCAGAGALFYKTSQGKDVQNTHLQALSLESRLIYPTDSLPVLKLPDGERRELRSVLNSTRPMQFGDYLWNDSGIPAGEVWIRIDLGHQTLSVFRAGHEIGSVVIIYGTDGKPTPVGVFHILEKARQHRSSLYDAEMPFMLRLTLDGVAIHASQVRKGSATHGCIGVPIDFARLLFNQTKTKDIVAILP